MRVDFRQRCAYCERPEVCLGGEESFEVDHFKPTSTFPELITHYPNLYYACHKCNQYKGARWPTPDQLSKGLRFADPCEEDMYLDHLRECVDGNLEALTNCGRYTCGHIRLNRQDLLTWRSLKRQVADDLLRFETAKMRLEQALSSLSDAAQRTTIDDEIKAIELTTLRWRDQFGL